VSPRHLVAALALLALPPAARAQSEGVGSPMTGSLELRVGNYRPNVDAAITGPTKPWADTFGGKRPLEFSLHAAKALPWRDYGTVEVGVGVGFFQASGHGHYVLDGKVAPDKTSFSMVPVALTLTYRLDLLMDRWSIPLVPYGRAALQRYNWWIGGPTGSTSKSGATDGYAYGGGVGLVLDFIDPVLARELDNDTGINHTMLVFDVSKTRMDDFGSKKSWDLSDTKPTYSFGLLFVF